MALLKQTTKKASAKKADAVAETSTKTVSAFVGTILRPHVTEKAATLAAQGVYVFVVHPKATRVEIGMAFKALYGVQSISVRVVNMDGKRVRFGRFYGRRSDWKKAMVAVPKGTTVDIHQGV